VSASIIPDLLDLFPDIVVVEEPTGFDRTGKPLGYGAARQLPARVLGQNKIVRGSDGQEKVSSVTVLFGGAFGVTPKARVTLPARFVPRNPTVIAISHGEDENGAHHERAYC